MLVIRHVVSIPLCLIPPVSRKVPINWIESLLPPRPLLFLSYHLCPLGFHLFLGDVTCPEPMLLASFFLHECLCLLKRRTERVRICTSTLILAPAAVIAPAFFLLFFFVFRKNQGSCGLLADKVSYLYPKNLSYFESITM